MARIKKIAGQLEGAIKTLAGTTGLNIVISTFGDLTGTNKWAYGALASNGYIYCCPSSSTSILKINTADNTTSTFGNITGNIKYANAITAANGKIYCMPSSATTVLVIDPSDDSFTTIAVGISRSWGAPAEAGGFIYSPSRGDTVEILKIDTSNDTLSTITTAQNLLMTGYAHRAADGIMYGVPESSNTAYFLDTADDSIITETGFASYSNIGLAQAASGTVYGAPFGSAWSQWYDPAQDTKGAVNTSAAHNDNTGYQGGNTFADSRVTFAPRNAVNILVIQDLTKSVYYDFIANGTGKWIGTGKGPNDDIYFIPFSSTSVGHIFDEFVYETAGNRITRVTKV